MVRLISNELNEKSILSNIKAGRLNKLVMLTGVYGTGKTEFAKIIARMLTCEDLQPNGYCGACTSCQKEIVYSINSFDASVHLLNMEKVTYEEMSTLVKQSVTKLRNSNEVYILDEFHLLDKKAQELWLAETSKLENCYIIMTTTDRRSVSDGILSRALQIPMKQLSPAEARELILANYPGAAEKAINGIIRKAGGSPRDLIKMALFYANSGLTDEELNTHLLDSNQEEIIHCLSCMGDRDLFFESLKPLRIMNPYSLKHSLQDILWDWLGATFNERYENMYYLNRFSEEQIMKFLLMSSQDAQLTILKMFQSITVKKPIAEDGVMQQNTIKASAESATPTQAKVTRWNGGK